jgi:hypothetical protein
MTASLFSIIRISARCTISVTVRGGAFLVMEHLVGETLAERLTKWPMSLDQALDISAQIAEALRR